MDTLLRAREVAEILNVRSSTVYALVERGVLPHVRITQGKRRSLIRFEREAIERVISYRTIGADLSVRAR